MHNPEIPGTTRPVTVLPEQKPAAEAARSKAWDPIEVWRKRVLVRESANYESATKAS